MNDFIWLILVVVKEVEWDVYWKNEEKNMEEYRRKYKKTLAQVSKKVGLTNLPKQVRQHLIFSAQLQVVPWLCGKSVPQLKMSEFDEQFEKRLKRELKKQIKFYNKLTKGIQK